MNMEYDVVMGCVLCGIAQEKASSSRCSVDAKKYGITLAKGFGNASHTWVEMRRAKEFYGQSPLGVPPLPRITYPF